MRIEPVVDEWLGPGEKDGEIIPLTPGENALHPEARSSRYYGEWWYFDARLDDGHVVVGFIQASELMSRKPGIELHVYKPDGEKLSVVKKFSHEQLRASTEKCDVWVGDNHCYAEFPESGNLPVHHLHIAEDGMEADLTFRSEVPGWKPGKGRTRYGNRGYFAWVVPAPRAYVEGSVRFGGTTLRAKGIGYHDHNVVTADMRRILSFWYWGRLYTEEHTLLYAYVKTNRRFGGKASKPLMLARGGEVILSSGEMRLREGPPVFNQVANRTYPAFLEMGIPDRVFLRLEVKRIIDANDFLSELNPVIMNPAVKWLVNRFMRPGWFRFESDFLLRVTHDGRSVEETGTTLHEMVALR
ncbi:lipocalin-like domain-containing protein [Candidatus Solincola tengchongensis]|uniref:lipocalin-like domain-containing protein n=1 Tax=Candidatus Solincola tengchongensis TaxID=2900693 RepID=UPI00257F83E7|nr:lipocalin-like domain-containing protein [Candidatus Solincola tengchongensis]